MSIIQLINEAISNETTLGLACKPYVDKRTRSKTIPDRLQVFGLSFRTVFQVPESLLMQLLKERLGQLDCVSKGWILHGFPLDRDQAFALDRAGFMPNK